MHEITILSIVFLGVAFLSHSCKHGTFTPKYLRYSQVVLWNPVKSNYGRAFNQLYITCGTYYIWTSKIYFTFQMKFDSFVLIYKILFNLWHTLHKNLFNMWLTQQINTAWVLNQTVPKDPLGLNVEDFRVFIFWIWLVHRIKIQISQIFWKSCVFSEASSEVKYVKRCERSIKLLLFTLFHCRVLVCLHVHINFI